MFQRILTAVIDKAMETVTTSVYLQLTDMCVNVLWDFNFIQMEKPVKLV